MGERNIGNGTRWFEERYGIRPSTHVRSPTSDKEWEGWRVAELRGIIIWIICLSHKNHDEDVVRNSVGEIVIDKSKLMALSVDSEVLIGEDKDIN